MAEWVGGTPEPDVKNGRAYVGLENGASQSGGVACVRISDGEILWNFAFADFTHASPAYSEKNRSVYCGSNGGDFARLDADT